MIDVHSHIIPKIDDGSASFEETYTMLKEAVLAGFTDIISTSHYIEDYYEENATKREEFINSTNKLLEEKQINLKLHCGSEIYITQNLVELIKENKASKLANSRYVLFELPMNNNVKYLRDIIFDIMSFDMIPIIAHPERYSYVQENPNILIPLIEQGTLFQGNYASIIGRYGNHAKVTIKKLLKANMIHFLGTDCHKKNDIYTKMKEIMIELNKIIGKEKLKELSTINPKHILKDEEIEIPNPNKIKNGFFKF